MRRPHLRMHCQRIEINLGALASAMTYGDRRAVVKKERSGFGGLRIAASDVELSPLAVSLSVASEL
jgi:hypothetical protein